MNLKDLLKQEVENLYPCVGLLMDMVNDDELDWKPSQENNWMTMGQLLLHIATACGAPIKGFVTGDWGLPEGMDVDNLKPEEMLPPAEALPTVSNVAEAKKALAEDKQTALQFIEQTSEDDLENKPAPAPWDPSNVTLGIRFLQMVEHLTSHKSQLFYYLKLQGKPVNTANLWAMPGSEKK